MKNKKLTLGKKWVQEKDIEISDSADISLGKEEKNGCPT